MNIWKMASEYLADQAKLQDLDLPPEVVLDTIDGMQGDIQDKIKAVLIISMELQALADARKAAAKAMVDSAKSLENRADWLRSNVQLTIQGCGLRLPLKYTEFSVNLQKNPLSCTIDDASKLAPHFIETEVTYHVAGDVTAMLKAIEAAGKKLGIKPPVVSLDVKPDKKAVLEALKEIEARNASRAPDEPIESMEGAFINPSAYRVTVK